MLQEQMTLPRGFTIRDPAGNRYVIEGILGKGGSSSVYLVKERYTKQLEFALKEVIDPDRREREHFIFEWEVLKRLKHPALPEVYSVFEHQKLRRVYILMTYIKGFDLERLRVWQPDKRFSVPLTLALMNSVVSAVSYLHQQDPPVVHRDIKPSNIIVPTGGNKAILVDFSIAKEYIPNSTTTAVRHGSPGYAAPEQYGTGTTPLTDIYGLGATIYTLLTGVIPTDALTRLTASKTDPLRPVKAVVPDIPTEVSEVVERAMYLNREDRFADVEQFWQAFCDAAQEKQASLDEIAGLRTGSLPHIRVRPIENVTTSSLRKKKDIPVVGGRKAPLLLVALFLLVALMSGILYFTVHTTPSANTHSQIGSTVIAKATHATTPTLFPTVSLYPELAIMYEGTTSVSKDTPINVTEKSPTQRLQLTDVHAKQNIISGDFHGLGQAGSFQGTITLASKINFTVTIYGGTSKIDFEGNIKLDSSMAGSYIVRSQNGQQTGDQGLWNASPFKI